MQNLRIREASPAELFAERLEQHASQMTFINREFAADYLRQAKMLREMASFSAPASVQRAAEWMPESL